MELNTNFNRLKWQLSLKVNTFITIEPIQEFKCIKFYAVKVEGDENGSEYNEFEKFNEAFREHANEIIRDEFFDIISIIEEIGENNELLRFLRPENSAFALPPKHKARIRSVKIKAHTKLRLYCVLLNNQIVILCNGGWKTENHPQDCPNVSTHFRLAEKLANYINKNRSDFPTMDKEMPVGDENGFYF